MMDSEYCEWLNATAERIAAALERIAAHLEGDVQEKRRQAEEKLILDERIAEAEARRKSPWGREQ